MVSLSSPKISDGRGGLISPSALSHLAVGTMVSRDLDAALRLYEDFLGFEAVRYAPDGMLIRDRRAKYLMEHGERDYFVIDVHQVENVEKPQKMLNHWGLSVGSSDEVRRLHQLAKSQSEKYWIKKVRPITNIHESYGFLFIDSDDNWWEIEHRSGRTNDFMFSQGDFDNRTDDEGMKIDPALPIATTKAAAVGPEAFMTHGTVDVASVPVTRRFYEQVLGLRSVQHYENAQFTAGGGDFAFVGVQVGSQTADQSKANRWILLVDDEEQLLARHRNALAHKEEFNIREITGPERASDGALSFLIYSPDANWFELSTRPSEHYSGIFKRLNATA